MREKREPVVPREVRMTGTTPDTHEDRLMDGLRLTAVGVLATVGLSLGFGVGHGWVGGVVGVGGVALLAYAFRVQPVRNGVAKLADWVIDRPLGRPSGD
jgi:small-conductance mechanosensitive channel